MSEHTKGPWGTIKATNGDIGISAPNCKNIIAECFAAINVHDETNPATEANANLIAAAPDMYEALKEVAERRTLSEHHGELDWLIDDARAAIAKAEGKA